MTIDWASLFKVAGVSLVFGVGIVVVFSIGLLGLSYAEGHTTGGRTAGDRTGGPGKPLGLAVAGLCLLICVGAVGYGIYLIVPQFH